ncbi:isoleucine--tRNA ligase cytoplasmic [Anaeramoeba ignava]|uniref:isoleucine--tRNA ligase n=1 Tax=Anaeramoeba ignava TaxID=1746090 RepID=A0A9Q0LUY8_ANAIG|nr:isoleucine--tRNA ligase cytoplasmic [Anaeramoeba ignava]|eukprot:Anaeramoba_ignava/a92286_339.p1 GENE.a92286_339~~a92286_339.p1  ORF type:complete len:1096 (+),score=330.06 a92286_339:26-3313(+)
MEFKQVSEKVNFAEEEEKILKYWEEIDAFQTSLKKSEGRKPYSFYDGPPFATGLPHYGHILAGTIKDIVTRYAHQTGHHVTRRFGWDTHGLPVEYEVDKMLGIKSGDDVMKLSGGIAEYNNTCRGIVMRYAKEWESIIWRLGRWIDFKNDYKTLDTSFMESVWWVFKQLFDKNLVYRGFKVMPFSTGCSTPLSNFEANLNYKDVTEPSIVVTFPLLKEPDVKLLAWTTTPWTLPSNLAVCVNPEFTYVQVLDLKSQQKFILLEKRINSVYPKKGEKQYQVLKKMTGKELEGLEYEPLFDYFINLREKGAFRVLCDSYVDEESGTGIVHMAPGFGEDDYRVCLANKIVEKDGEVVCPVNSTGNFTEEVSDFQGRYVKDCDKDITRLLKEKKRLINQEVTKHSYPFCWRSNTPLIYKAVPSWFVHVESIKEKLLVNNLQSRWVPKAIQEGRFHNWLKDAKDWSISRSRFWGTPLPIWTSENYDEIVVVGSVKELEDLTGAKDVTDLHRDKIDDLTIESKLHPGEKLHRVSEVFDCWFESGSMPYGQLHYPFENKEVFEKTFPADFCAEGLDQTRGWFYTLLVLSTALFDKPPFKNLIVNGLVLDKTKKKMSKRDKNYPDPLKVVNKYGADALRLYLINSPVVHADPLVFQEVGVHNVNRNVFLPWYNAYRFFVQQSLVYSTKTKTNFKPDRDFAMKSTNFMDQWILSSTLTLLKFFKNEMSEYRLYTVIPKLVKFIDQLTNWYVRFNRMRLKGKEGEEQQLYSLTTLFEVLLVLCKTMAPFTPFFTEFVYQNLSKCLPDNQKEDSVHFEMIPEIWSEKTDEDIERIVSRMQEVIILGRKSRERKNLSLKLPLSELILIHHSEDYLKDLKRMESYIKEELNVRSIRYETKEKDWVTYALRPDGKALGEKLGKKFGDVSQEAKKLNESQIYSLLDTGKITLAGFTIERNEFKIIRQFVGDKNLYAGDSGDEATISLDITLNDDLLQEYFARQIISKVQKLRKNAKLLVSDVVDVFYQVENDGDGKSLKSPCLNTVINSPVYSLDFKKAFNSVLIPLEKLPKEKLDSRIIFEESQIGDSTLKLSFYPAGTFELSNETKQN